MFGATIGGLGLTGIIEWAELQLVKIGSAYLDVEIIPYDNLDAFWPLAQESAERFEHTVAWTDCMAQGANAGRGVFSRANWSTDGVYSAHSDDTWKTVPIDLPGIALNRALGDGVQRALLPAERGQDRGPQAALCDFFLSARRDLELESPLWSPRHAAISVRGSLWAPSRSHARSFR